MKNDGAPYPILIVNGQQMVIADVYRQPFTKQDIDEFIGRIKKSWTIRK